MGSALGPQEHPVPNEPALSHSLTQQQPCCREHRETCQIRRLEKPVARSLSVSLGRDQIQCRAGSGFCFCDIHLPGPAAQRFNPHRLCVDTASPPPLPEDQHYVDTAMRGQKSAALQPQSTKKSDHDRRTRALNCTGRTRVSCSLALDRAPPRDRTVTGGGGRRPPERPKAHIIATAPE